MRRDWNSFVGRGLLERGERDTRKSADVKVVRQLLK